MLRHLQVFCVAAVVALVASAVRADDAKPAPVAAPAAANDPTAQLKDRIVKAYKDAKQYQSEVAFELSQKIGRWTTSQRGTFTVRFDRDGAKLLVDTPNFVMACDNGKLRLKSDEVSERHFATDAAKLDYGALSELVPMLGRPPLPDVALLLSQDPFSALSGGASSSTKVLDADPSDPQKRQAIEAVTPMGKMTFRVDGKTSMVTGLKIELDELAAGGKPAVLNYEIKVSGVNQAIDAKAFAFDAGSTKGVDTLEEWATGRAPRKNGPDEEKHALQGKDAPAISLNTLDGKAYKLADDKSGVIVLDFWATWCPPCRKGLPKLQAVYDWAQKEKKSVAIYAVNVQEKNDQVADFWKESKFTMPVLMDAEGKASEGYGVQGIPQTVIIANGKVQHVHVGFRQDMDEVIKKQVEVLLAKGNKS